MKRQELDKNCNNVNYYVKKHVEEFSVKDFVENLLNEGTKISCDNSNIYFENDDNRPPEFYDEEKFKNGQKFFHKHIVSMLFSKLLGLIVILSVPTILNVLMFTKLSSTSLAAYKRYVATLFHVYIWYSNDLSPNSKFWKSLNDVKGRHNCASKRYGKACHFNITQKDMVLTQFGFMGFVLVRSKQVGLHEANDEEWESFIHVWKVIGRLLGIEDRFNICRDSVEETREICEELIEKVFKVQYSKREENFLTMAKALIVGMWCVQPFLNVKVILAYIYTRFLILNDTSSNVNPNLYSDDFNRFESFYLKFLVSSMAAMHNNLLRLFGNLLQYIALWLMRNFPFLAYYKFGLTNTRVKILC